MPRLLTMHQILVFSLYSVVVSNILAPGTSFMENNFSTDGERGVAGGGGSGGNGSSGERWGVADEASLTRLPLTSCCAAQFLTGRGPVLVHGLGVGDPCSRGLMKISETIFLHRYLLLGLCLATASHFSLPKVSCLSP